MERQEPTVVVETKPVEPFVNEECGDTMWDAVLQQTEEKITNAVWCSPTKIEG